MGTALSSATSPQYTREELLTLLGDRFDDATFEALKSEEGVVTLEQLVAAASAAVPAQPDAGTDAAAPAVDAAPVETLETPPLAGEEAAAAATAEVLEQEEEEEDAWVDAWRERSADELYALLGGDGISADARAGTIVGVVVEPNEDDEDESFAAAAERAVLAATEGDALALSRSDETDLSDFTLTGEAARRVFSLDLSGSDIAALPNLTDFYARELDLSGCEELRPAGFATSFGPRTCGTLLHLDLSFVGDLELGELDFSQLSALRRLSLEGCDLANLGEGTARWEVPTLRVLSIADNALESYDVFAVLAGLTSLTWLDASENEWGVQAINAGKSKFCAAALGALPALLKLNNKVIPTKEGAVRAAQSFAAMEGLSNYIGRGGTVADDHQYSDVACSCEEGAACVTPECCKDWKHRFEIAAYYRKEKGLDLEEKRRGVKLT